MVSKTADNNFATAKWIVDATAGRGTHTTIASALASASSGDTIFIRPGTYTENPTLKAGVNLAAFECDALTPNVIINGTCTATFAGACSISGIRLQTNSATFLTVSGSAATIVWLKNCFLNCSNNNGISYSSSSSSSQINILDCYGDVGTTGITLFTSSSAGTLQIRYTKITNSGGSSTASTASAGSVLTTYLIFFIPITTSSTATLSFNLCNIDTTGQNVTCLTLGGSGTNSCLNTSLKSGTASTISISSNLTLEFCEVSSSNANAITGGGTLNVGIITFESSSSTINTTTVTSLVTTLGIFHLNAIAVSNLLYASSAGVIGGLATANSGVLATNSSGVPSIDTTNFAVLSTGLQLKGNNTNTASPAGFIGEVIRSTASAVAISNGSTSNIASVALTAGNWMITGSHASTATGGTAVCSGGAVAISTANNTLGTFGVNYNNTGDTGSVFVNYSSAAPTQIVSLSGNATYYLNVNINYTSTTCPTSGVITAVRIG